MSENSKVSSGRPVTDLQLVISNDYNGVGAIHPSIHLVIALDYMHSIGVNPEDYVNTPVLLLVKEVDGVLHVGMTFEVYDDMTDIIPNIPTVVLSEHHAVILRERKQAMSNYKQTLMLGSVNDAD